MDIEHGFKLGFFLARIPNFGTLLTKIYHLLAPKSDLNSLSLEMNLLNT